jgi:hypothetical protein
MIILNKIYSQPFPIADAAVLLQTTNFSFFSDDKSFCQIVVHDYVILWLDCNNLKLMFNIAFALKS